MGFVCLTSNHQTMNHVQGWLAASGFLASADDPPEIPDPVLTSFREAEVLGLKYMQEGDYEQAVKRMFRCSAWNRSASFDLLVFS